MIYVLEKSAGEIGKLISKANNLIVLFDKQLIDKARDYLGLSDLEKQNMAGGVLNVHIGDVFSSSVAIPGGYAGKFYIHCRQRLCKYFVYMLCI